MARFFVSPEQISAGTIRISGPDVNHIRNVLRMQPGDEVSVSDGCGRDYFCVITQIDGNQVLLRIENSWDSYVELKTKLYLFQGLPKGDKMDLIIQKAVELGAYQVIPVRTMRTIVKWTPEKENKKRERWQLISESAAKQSGRALIPQVLPVQSFEQALDRAKTLSAAVMPYERAKGMDASRELVSHLKDRQSIGIFIGPEGGFDPEEVCLAQDAGIQTLTLGRRILRTETAGLAMLSILMFELEDQ